MKQSDAVVSASEIAAWAWCPESWRLDVLEVGRDDDGNIRYGEAFHDRTAVFERRSRSATSLGWWLLVLAVLVALIALVLMGGSNA